MKKTLLSISLFCLAAVMPASAGVLYSNGPVLGTGDAWTINFGFVVSDSFTLSASGTVTGFTFATWAFPGDTMSAVDWSIGSATYGNDLGSGTAAVSNSFLFNNSNGFDVYTNTVSGLNLSLAAGTYWLSLQNAVASNGDPIYWDENDGPSQAFENSVGQLPGGNDCANGQPTCTGSQTFDIIGDAGSSVPEPGSIGLLGAGIVAMAGILRRKIVKA